MAHIEIKGIIGQDYTYSKFITDFANARGEMIRLSVDSPGGAVNEGEQIADFISQKADSFISVQNSGDVASIASTIFLALPYEKRFFNPSKGVALIHNPYLEPQSFIGVDTTAAGLSVISSELQEAESKISKYIAKQTGADIDVVRALMSVNEPLSDDQLRSINFAQIIQFKAVAFLNLNNMKEEEVKNLIESKLEASNENLWNRFIALFNKRTKFVALMVTDAEGKMINFPDVPDGVELVIGDMASFDDGGVPSGEVVMADGRTFVFDNGKLTEIKEAIVVEPTEDVEALKAKITELEAQLTAQNLAAQATEHALKAQIKSQMIPTVPVEKPIVTTEPESGWAKLREKVNK